MVQTVQTLLDANMLYGIDDADQIQVFDPNSASRSARRWGVVEVLNEVEAMWAYY